MRIYRILKILIFTLLAGILYNALAHYDARPYPIFDIIFQIRHVIFALILTALVVGYEFVKTKIFSDS